MRMPLEEALGRMRYRGSLKHKSWRPGGGFGTMCPEWTHQADGQGFAGNTDRHPWSRTRAHEMFGGSICGGDGRRYATGRGIAFVALPTNDGTWHGYPLPWVDVPRNVREHFVNSGLVDARRIRRQTVGPSDRRWALSSEVDDAE